jgi:hypothetical protein
LKKVIFLISLLVIVVAFVSGQFYKDLPTEERQLLGEAYYLVGERYREVGKTEKGNDFIRMAKRIYPQLDPEKIDAKRILRKPEVEVRGEWTPKYEAIPQGVAARNGVYFRFSKFLLGFYTENTSLIREILDDTIYTPSTVTGISRNRAIDYLNTFFENYPVAETPPDTMFDLQSIEADPVSRSVWQARVSFSEEDPFNLTAYLEPNRQTQNFYFQIDGGKWSLFAAGFQPDEMQHIITPKKTIKNMILDSITAFINKDTEETLSYFNDSLRVVPYNETITKQELRETILGYYEEFDLSGIGSITVTLDIVEAGDEDFISGRGYKAYVEFPQHIVQQLPLWPEFTGYYVIYDENARAWKIAGLF